jgi:hypothetical protein
MPHIRQNRLSNNERSNNRDSAVIVMIVVLSYLGSVSVVFKN